MGRFFAEGVTRLPPLNRTPAWGEANRYLEQALSQWAATEMQNEGFFANLEQKMHRRLGLDIAPHRKRMVEEVVASEGEEASRMFGESLPIGLRLSGG